jgi:hypothetical protein
MCKLQKAREPKARAAVRKLRATRLRADVIVSKSQQTPDPRILRTRPSELVHQEPILLQALGPKIVLKFCIPSSQAPYSKHYTTHYTITCTPVKMWGRLLLTLDSVGLIAGSLKADYFSETHMFNPNWPPHAKYV